jgi:hypothetical protein
MMDFSELRLIQLQVELVLGLSLAILTAKNYLYFKLVQYKI